MRVSCALGVVVAALSLASCGGGGKETGRTTTPGTTGGGGSGQPVREEVSVGRCLEASGYKVKVDGGGTRAPSRTRRIVAALSPDDEKLAVFESGDAVSAAEAAAALRSPSGAFAEAVGPRLYWFPDGEPSEARKREVRRCMVAGAGGAGPAPVVTVEPETPLTEEQRVQQTVNRFFIDWRAGRAAEVCAAMTPAGRDELVRELRDFTGAADCEGAVAGTVAVLRGASWSLGGEYGIRGDEAYVVADFSDDYDDQHMSLVRLDGQWKIDRMQDRDDVDGQP